MLVIFTLFPLKIETELGTDEEAGDPEANGELELSRVSEMRIILADPNQCILLH
jgi:chloride channel, nucleotide-sensitive, 1A